MGSGTVAAVWEALSAPVPGTLGGGGGGRGGGGRGGMAPQLTAELQALEAGGRYVKYIAIVEGLLSARLRTHGIGELEMRLW